MLNISEGESISVEQWKEAAQAPEYVNQLCRYIANDFATFEDTCHDESMGFMVVSASTNQAKGIQKWFEDNTDIPTALVLCGEEDNKNKQEYFRGKRDKLYADLEDGNGKANVDDICFLRVGKLIWSLRPKMT